MLSSVRSYRWCGGIGSGKSAALREAVSEAMARGVRPIGYLPATTDVGLRTERVEFQDREVARMLGADQLEGRLARHLSSGERQRVRLASTLSTSTSFAALDEPCRHLDPEHIEALNVVLEQRMNGGMQLGVCDSRRLLKSSLFQKEDTSAQEDCVLDVGVAKAGEGEKLRIEIPVPFLLSATGRAVRRQPVEIAAGSLVVVRGTNGSGKTSLIEALANAASRAGRKVGISRQEPEQQVFASTPAIEFSEVSAAHEGSLWSKGG